VREGKEIRLIFKIDIVEGLHTLIKTKLMNLSNIYVRLDQYVKYFIFSTVNILHYFNLVPSADNIHINSIPIFQIYNTIMKIPLVLLIILVLASSQTISLTA
jgi:hypothetical protein